MKIIRLSGILLLLLCHVALASENPIRKWTNTTGNVIEGELTACDGVTATLLVNGKTFRVPASALSQPDRDWLEKWREEKQQQASALIGLRVKAPIAHRYGRTTDDYFAGPFGKKARRFYDTTASICDDSKKGVFMKCDESVAWKDETMLVYCPASYRENSLPMGVYLNISAGEGPIQLQPGYDQVMDRRKLIYVSPSGTSNDRSDVRRMALALDALATVRAEYKIDNERVFVGGVSGGGAMSAWMAVYFPEFRGALCQVRNEYIPNERCFPAVEEKDVRGIVHRNQAYAWITGPKDFNYKPILECGPRWQKKGFISKVYDVPGMGHQEAPSATLEQALEWAEASSKPPKSS